MIRYTGYIGEVDKDQQTFTLRDEMRRDLLVCSYTPEQLNTVLHFFSESSVVELNVTVALQSIRPTEKA
jgi:hypothetical protein